MVLSTRHIRLEATSSSNSANIYYNNDLVIQNNSPGGDFYFKDDAGTNAMSLFSTGNMTIAGTLTQNSDARLKKNIQPLQNSLQKYFHSVVINITGKKTTGIKVLQTGLLARVEQQMPELVKKIRRN
ncbi:MAG: tail fiber domain-containing protein [Chitinophagaceae bacterium]|nr:tail fiber domain-containing protein [Chitinophagaceae bacterium]